MKLSLTVDFEGHELPEVAILLSGLADLGVAAATPTIRTTSSGDMPESSDSGALPQAIEEYLAQHDSPNVGDARRLLAAAADGYQLFVGGSKSEPYVMVFAPGPRQIGALAYVRLRHGHLRLRLPKESARGYQHATATPTQRLYQVDVPLSAPTDELLGALLEAVERGKLPGRWMGDPEVVARRQAAKEAREAAGQHPAPDDGDDFDGDDTMEP